MTNNKTKSWVHSCIQYVSVYARNKNIPSKPIYYSLFNYGWHEHALISSLISFLYRNRPSTSSMQIHLNHAYLHCRKSLLSISFHHCSWEAWRRKAIRVLERCSILRSSSRGFLRFLRKIMRTCWGKSQVELMSELT